MTTPTIDTLTAEVHVLKVGPRQLTKSMYRQLDQIPPAHLEPFGRVKVGRYALLDMEVELVGRSTRTGALARATLDYGTGDWQATDSARKLPLIVLGG